MNIGKNHVLVHIDGDELALTCLREIQVLGWPRYPEAASKEKGCSLLLEKGESESEGPAQSYLSHKWS